jgi:hypothetical protein
MIEVEACRGLNDEPILAVSVLVPEAESTARGD